MAAAQKDAAILGLLVRLSGLYWRPDRTPSQQREVLGMYIEDLRPYALADIVDAVKKYRRAPDATFFPTPGQLLAFIEAVPSWDVISKSHHIADQREAGRRELAAAVKQITANPTAHIEFKADL